MFQDDFSAVATAAANKVTFLKKNPLGYFVASMLAGIYVGFGILLIFTIGGMLGSQPYTKLIMGLSFGIALSLVIMAGAELFTGNNFIMTSGVFSKTVSWKDTAVSWVVCFLGNWTGAIVLAVIFYLAGFTKRNVGEFIAAAAATKMSIPLLPLFLRGILCNILVCLAVWCGFKLKSESGKCIMIFWCLFAFITCGFEHSVANMTLLTISLFAPFESAVSLSGYLYNIFVVSLGNMAGGILFVAVPYFLIARKKEV